MMQASGEFRRYADEQAAENTVVQRRVQSALRDAAARIDALEKKCLELDAACCEYQRQRDALQEQVQSVTAERAHAVSSLGENADRFRNERDEARRELCMVVAGKCGKSAFASSDAVAEAQRRGWDCFPEVTQ